MLSKRMRFRRLVLSVALLVVILVALKMIQPADGSAKAASEHNAVPAVEKCEMKGCADSCQCSGNCCSCCQCKKGAKSTL